ncbi:hypothetical protein QOZ88_06045 [Blastococcus sp. BMG 814]|uniref:Uncharacterized protein n=1 Tax=Blastococcus carthaginiensis TaxID=3050034 RepID=A0ABT9I9E2_9ACTN|nr:hypothetical protein [Blastococcus carthaginiensis]MDP5182192.1 hypothetical protein [Blastococcus carthaginiensis]
MTAGLYVRQGSRFVPVDEARPLPPIPTPVRVPDVDDEPQPRPEGGWAVHAPRCPHGSFARWAARNCCATRSTR